MRPIKSFAIRPRLPENLSVLSELAFNMWWQWNYEAVDMFRRLSRRLWEQSAENPVQVLLRCEQERLNYLSHEEGFLNHVQRVYTDFRKYMTEPRWFQKNYPERQDLRVAYFSAEFGLGSCVPVYSGGLGILAGDHLKTASDMGIPLVGVGLAYRQGYFHQYLNIDGWQQERYDDNDFYTMPAEPVLDAGGARLRIDIPYLNRPVIAEMWRINVGRLPLYLLTTNLVELSPTSFTAATGKCASARKSSSASAA
jgi:starch phosphorylase